MFLRLFYQLMHAFGDNAGIGDKVVYTPSSAVIYSRFRDTLSFYTKKEKAELLYKEFPVVDSPRCSVVFLHGSRTAQHTGVRIKNIKEMFDRYPIEIGYRLEWPFMDETTEEGHIECIAFEMFVALALARDCIEDPSIETQLDGKSDGPNRHIYPLNSDTIREIIGTGNGYNDAIQFVKKHEAQVPVQSLVLEFVDPDKVIRPREENT